MSEKLVTIRRVQSEAEGSLLKAKLESKGIPAIVIMPMPRSRDMVQLRVRENDAKAALKIIGLAGGNNPGPVPQGMVMVRLFRTLTEAYICQEKLKDAGIKGSRVQDTDIKRFEHIALLVKEQDIEKAAEIIARQPEKSTIVYGDFLLSLIACGAIITIGILMFLYNENLPARLIFLGLSIIVLVIFVFSWIKRIRRKQAMEKKES